MHTHMKFGWWLSLEATQAEGIRKHEEYIISLLPAASARHKETCKDASLLLPAASARHKKACRNTSMLPPAKQYV